MIQTPLNVGSLWLCRTISSGSPTSNMTGSWDLSLLVASTSVRREVICTLSMSTLTYSSVSRFPHTCHSQFHLDTPDVGPDLFHVYVSRKRGGKCPFSRIVYTNASNINEFHPSLWYPPFSSFRRLRGFCPKSWNSCWKVSCQFITTRVVNDRGLWWTVWYKRFKWIKEIKCSGRQRGLRDTGRGVQNEKLL